MISAIQIDENIVNIQLKNEILSTATLERNFYTTSSCGVCGKSSVDAILTKSIYPIDTKKISVSNEVLFSLQAKLLQVQSAFESTGGLHASALFHPDGSYIFHYKDVGRHNALDKLIGNALINDRLPLRDHLLLLSGRASFELIQKASMAGIPIIVAALSYPNRRVQYDAALAISAAAPAQPFPGSERVVPTLASAIRDAGTQYAVVIANDNESYQSVRKILEKSKYQVLPFGTTLADIAAPVSEAPGVDLVVIANLSAAKSGEVVGEIRSNSRTSAAPALILAPADSIGDLRNAYSRDRLVAVRSVAMGEETISKAAESLVQTGAGGGITGDEAKAFAGRSLAALRDLAVSGNQALKVEDASAALVGGLANSTLSRGGCVGT